MIVRSVAVLGAGIMGASTALWLARRGVRVVMFDAADVPFSGASRWNEGKIHLGYLYSAAPSLETARRLLPGGLAFRRLVEELIGCPIGAATTAGDDHVLLHRDSVVGADVSGAYLRAVAALVGAHPDAGDYLVDARRSTVIPLTRAELAGVASTRDVVAGYRVPERSVSTRWIADRFVSALASEPNIKLAMNETVARVACTTPDGHGGWHVHAATGRHGPFDAVVNALWHGRPAIDRAVADCADREQHYRYRVAIFLRSTTPVRLPNLLIAVGPYGDVKNYNERDFYLSWYPAGLLLEHQGGPPPATPVLDDARRQQIARDMFEALIPLLPGVAQLRDRAEELAVQGGWVYAQARGSLDDPRSTLHVRDRLGITWFGSYASVDTGKYSVAPFLARAIADRLKPLEPRTIAERPALQAR